MTPGRWLVASAPRQCRNSPRTGMGAPDFNSTPSLRAQVSMGRLGSAAHSLRELS